MNPSFSLPAAAHQLLAKTPENFTDICSAIELLRRCGCTEAEIEHHCMRCYFGSGPSLSLVAAQYQQAFRHRLEAQDAWRNFMAAIQPRWWIRLKKWLGIA